VVYEKTIPYDGRVLGVLGDQFTIDIGKASFVRVGQKVTVRRPIRKRKHPLLKEIVGWDTKLIGTGRIFNVSEFQARAVIKNYESKTRLKSQDWVTISKATDKITRADPQSKYPNLEKI